MTPRHSSFCVARGGAYCWCDEDPRVHGQRFTPPQRALWRCLPEWVPPQDPRRVTVEGPARRTLQALEDLGLAEAEGQGACRARLRSEEVRRVRTS